MGTPPKTGIPLLLQDDYLSAASPLFDEGVIAALEWNIDIPWGVVTWQLPGWVEEILDTFSQEGALYGHGVMYSTLSGTLSARQQRWLVALEREARRRKYVHISEHFGFMTAGPFYREGAPLPVPMTDQTIALGQDRVRRLFEAAGTRVGLENLGTALSPQDARDQGAFLDALLAPTDGFLILDLHNLWCHAQNFGYDAAKLMLTYPLHRVRELHLSGGSWFEAPSVPGRAPVRRDTHDDAVPAEVFQLLPLALDRCPDVEVVILERLPGTFRDAADMARYRDDYHRMAEIVEAHHG